MPLYICAAIVFLLLTGCSTRPLPEDVTRETTTAIVQKIQCEAREALDHISEAMFLRSPDTDTQRLADLVATGSVRVPDLFAPGARVHPLLTKADEQLALDYTLSAVTFDFKFTISETNDNGGNADFRLPVVGGVFTLGLSAGGKLQRQNVRKFQITNSFFELHDIEPAACRGIVAKVGNVIYPITGRIGLEEVFLTFLELDSGAGTTKVPDNAHLFTDTLTFTTTLSASAAPKITLDPVAMREFRVADAYGSLSAERVDVHEVAIALAKGPRFLSVDAARRGAKVQSRIIANQNRVDFFFNGYGSAPLGTLPP